MKGWNKIFHKIIFIGVLSFLIINFLNVLTEIEFCNESKGKILYVGGSGIGNYSKIQDAIDKSIDRDIIYIFNGTYNENIVINKSINLIGNDKTKTSIIGNNSLYTILIKTQRVNITKLAIEKSRVGIYISGYNNSNNNISNNIIAENWEGIRIQNSSNNIIINNFIENNANYGIVLYESRKNQIKNNTFIDDHTAIFFGRWSDKNEIFNNNITENIFGINLEYSFKNLIYNNSIANGTRGISFSFSKDNNATNNIIKNHDHSGIFLSDSDENIILPNMFSDNYQDIKKDSKPPVVKTPGFEIFFMIIAIIIIKMLRKKSI
jgi:parallel beta-helix repeat protein